MGFRESWSARYRLVLVLCAGLSMAGCSGRSTNSPTGSATSPTSTAPVVAENVLNLYEWSGQIDPTVISAFEREYGIKVTTDVLDSEEELETKLLIGHSNYDVVVPGGAFLERQIETSVYQKLDKTRLPNLKYLDPEAVRGMGLHDPGNLYAVAYMWSTTGIGYDIRKIKARMADPPLDSWRLIFDPTVVAKFQDCGISVLDAPADVTSAVLVYLRRDPNSEDLSDLKKAEQVLLSIRPFVRTINSDKYMFDLANGDLCLALAWSGDVGQARDRAKEANTIAVLNYSIPREGTISLFDALAIPADAPHPDAAHTFINYLMRPDVAAKDATVTKYGSPVPDALPLLAAELRDDPGIYPPLDVRARVVSARAHSQQFTRELMRMWTRFKTGK
jgi:putrescine transport system substrate-binding protein